MSSGGKRSRALLFTLSLLPLCLAYACGGQTSTDDDASGRGGKTIRPDGGPPDSSTAGKGGSSATDPDAGPDAGRDGGLDWLDGGDAEPNPYEDPGCPDAAAPPGVVECDPF